MKALAAAVLLFAAGPCAAADPEEDPALPEAATLKSLVYSQGGSYAITQEDLLWLARMVHGETGGYPTREDADAMLWAIAQRKYFAKGFRSWTLTKLVQKYSQPVNTKWLRDGSGCRKHNGNFKDLPKSDPCAEHRFAKREKYATLPWEDIDAVARRAVVDFAQGKSQNTLPGGVGWFAKSVWDRREKNGANADEWEKPVFGWEIEHNVFYRSAAKATDTQNWTGGEVAVQ